MQNQAREEESAPDQEESVALPLFRTWRGAYLAVVAAFFVEVTFFYFVSRYFL